MVYDLHLCPLEECVLGVELIVHGIGSLCCGNADEAKTLIPSLQDKIKDDDLDDLLAEIFKLQNR